MPLTPALEGKGKQISVSMSSRAALSTQLVPGELKLLYRETLPEKTIYIFQ